MHPRLMILALMLAPLPLAGQTMDIEEAPGRLVSVDDRRLHLYCIGSGSPTVVIEAGASSFAIDFSLIQPGIAEVEQLETHGGEGIGS